MSTVCERQACIFDLLKMYTSLECGPPTHDSDAEAVPLREINQVVKGKTKMKIRCPLTLSEYDLLVPR